MVDKYNEEKLNLPDSYDRVKMSEMPDLTMRKNAINGLAALIKSLDNEKIQKIQSKIENQNLGYEVDVLFDYWSDPATRIRVEVTIKEESEQVLFKYEEVGHVKFDYLGEVKTYFNSVFEKESQISDDDSTTDVTTRNISNMKLMSYDQNNHTQIFFNLSLDKLVALNDKYSLKTE